MRAGRDLAVIAAAMVWGLPLLIGIAAFWIVKGRAPWK